MKKAFLIMASAMAFMSMVAAPGADKKDALKTPVSRTDLVTQTERLMSAFYSDGFGLDAEEYELLMGQEFDMLDDLAGSITMPSCAGNAMDLQRKPKNWDEPIPRPVPGFPHVAPDLPISDGSVIDGMVKGNVRPGDEPNVAAGDGGSDAPDLQQKRTRDWDEPLPPPVRGKATANDLSDNPNGSSGGSSFEDMVKGNVRPGDEPNVAAGDGGSDAPDLQRRYEWDKPLIPIGTNFCLSCTTDLSGGNGGSSGGSGFEDMIKGNVKPGNTH